MRITPVVKDLVNMWKSDTGAAKREDKVNDIHAVCEVPYIVFRIRVCACVLINVTYIWILECNICA